MPDPAGAFGAVVLAAGASVRLGQAKQLLRYCGESLLHRAARLALDARPLDAVVVLGAQAETMHAVVADLPIRCIVCADWHRGLGASLRAGVDALIAPCSGVLVALCDQPLLDSAHLVALGALWREHPERGAASFYSGRLGVPALLPRTWFDLLDADSDRGARELLAARHDHIDAVRNEALAMDVDTPADLAVLDRDAAPFASPP